MDDNKAFRTQKEPQQQATNKKVKERKNPIHFLRILISSCLPRMRTKRKEKTRDWC